MHRIYEYIVDRITKYEENILDILRTIINFTCLILICISIACSISGVIFTITGKYHRILMMFILSIPGYYIMMIEGIHWTVIVICRIRDDYQKFLKESVNLDDGREIIH